MIPPDPGLPGVRGLVGAGGITALESFLAERGWHLDDARPVQALYRPGRSCVVRYRAVATPPAGNRRSVTLCAETRARPRGSVGYDSGVEDRCGMADPVDRLGPYLVWAFPYDPSLESAPEASSGKAARDALASVGRRPLGVSVQPLRYRPRRRALFRYVATYGDGCERRVVFAKVLRSRGAARAQDVADALRPRGLRGQPGFRLSLPIAAPARDSLLFAPAQGRALTELLINADRLPTPNRIASVVDAMARRGRRAGRIEAPRHRLQPVEAARRTADVLGRLVPHAVGDIARVVDEIERGSARGDAVRRPVHGDLYEAQIFVSDDFSLTLIDLDDAGIGDPALDAANFTGHLLALALSRPRARARVLAYRSVLKDAFGARLDVSPADIAWREALIMLQLATGPFRVMSARWPEQVEKRIGLAARLVDERCA